MERISLSLLAPDALDLDQLTYRWVHLIGGIVWMAMLYGFTLVHNNAVAALDADARRKAIPEYVPRTLFWFKWGALVTWVTGVALLMKLYYSSKSAPILYAATSEFAGQHMPAGQWGMAFGGLLALFLVYDLVARFGGKHAELTYLLWAAVAVGYGCILDTYLDMSNRAILIHVGALIGT